MAASPLTIIIADDDALVREAYKSALESRGHAVLLAEDGVGALAFAETHPVDLILLDIVMPRKEGLETLIELKHRFPNLKVFAMSSAKPNGSVDFLTIAQKFGADGILRKPILPQKLVDILENWQTGVDCSSGGGGSHWSVSKV